MAIQEYADELQELEGEERKREKEAEWLTRQQQMKEAQKVF